MMTTILKFLGFKKHEEKPQDLQQMEGAKDRLKERGDELTMEINKLSQMIARLQRKDERDNHEGY